MRYLHGQRNLDRPHAITIPGYTDDKDMIRTAFLLNNKTTGKRFTDFQAIPEYRSRVDRGKIQKTDFVVRTRPTEGHRSRVAG